MTTKFEATKTWADMVKNVEVARGELYALWSRDMSEIERCVFEEAKHFRWED